MRYTIVGIATILVIAMISTVAFAQAPACRRALQVHQPMRNDNWLLATAFESSVKIDSDNTTTNGVIRKMQEFGGAMTPTVQEFADSTWDITCGLRPSLPFKLVVVL